MLFKKFHTSKTQWHRVNSLIPKQKPGGLERQGSIKATETGKTNFRSCHSVSIEAHGSSQRWASKIWAALVLRPCHLQPAWAISGAASAVPCGSISKCSQFPASLWECGLHGTAQITFPAFPASSLIVSPITFLGTAYRKPEPLKHCLAYQAFL